MSEQATYTADELVRLGAQSADFFYRIFFPRTMRQRSADFHLEFDRVLDDPQYRYVLAKMFRDSAKTSRLRMCMARRIAYGISHSIFYLGASEAHATRSIRWVRAQVTRNRIYSGTFGLSLGSKQGETEIEIINESANSTIWLLGSGVTGSVRGINFDDYRPDFIICDDIVNEEGTLTLESMEKDIGVLYGAIRNSLAPAADEPNAKMVVAQTPIRRGDIVEEMEGDPQVHKLEVPIWTDETMDLPVDQQVSRWEERWPSEVVRADKKAHAARNRLSIFIREKEVRLVSPEKRAFRSDWLKRVDIMPAHTRRVLSIDPVPPPSEVQLNKGLANKDFEALVVCGQLDADYYVHDYEVNRGHDPSWTVAKFFELVERHDITTAIVEGVAYQRTLKWILEQEMRRRGKWVSVAIPKADKRPKYNKIVSTLNGIAANGHLYCMSWMTDLIQQFEDYPEVPHEDVLEAAAQGIAWITNPVLEVGADEYMLKHGLQNYKAPRIRSAP